MENDSDRIYCLDEVVHITSSINKDDEPLVSAFIERWHPETHTFHVPFEECTITLQDVAYQQGLLTDGEYVSGYLTEFETYIEGG
ncbi:hypothetical protein Ahy_B01g052805 [Arachis hypogaea]|uniref:Aminotransferase-like plant mobile domain-containing protein n=1 Tax=Arachis hypogaea TaxID=3818 RepID=A0A445AQH5_ARAHY|nr:hypothetical protein Ahy_B01g052805 [Arachis hypogaea]